LSKVKKRKHPVEKQQYNSARTTSVEGHCEKQEERYSKSWPGKLCAKFEYKFSPGEYTRFVTNLAAGWRFSHSRLSVCCGRFQFSASYKLKPASHPPPLIV
jgi:hypothetical protein